MIQKGKEGLPIQRPEINQGRRKLLVGTVALTGTMLAIDAVSKAKPAYAAVKATANFRERRKSVNVANSSSLDTPATFDTSQGQQVNIQDTPTPDTTVAALQKRILQDKAKNLEASPPSQPSWLEKYIVPFLTPAAAVGTLGWGIVQFNKNRELDRKKRDEARFRSIVSDLGSQNIETKTGAAVLMRTFLNPKHKDSYRRYYDKIFHLEVIYLRLRKV